MPTPPKPSPLIDRVWGWVDALSRATTPQSLRTPPESAGEDLPTIQAHYEAQIAQARAQSRLQGYEEAKKELEQSWLLLRDQDALKHQGDVQALIAAHKEELEVEKAKAREEAVRESTAHIEVLSTAHTHGRENAAAEGYWAGVKAAYDVVRTLPQSATTRASEEAFEASRRRFCRVLKVAVHDKAWKAEED